MILIDALFIANQGGGPNLLRYLLDKIKEHRCQDRFFLLLDTRFTHDVSAFKHLNLKASLTKRYKFYIENRKRFSKVFCFANTPPPIKLKVPVATYFHNQMLLESRRHLLDRRYHRFYLRYMFVKFFNRNTDKYIVQSDHMVDEIVGSGLKKKEDCICFPFYKLADLKGLPFEQRKMDFVYISSASFYKNHTTLLDAWDLLFEQGLSPTLHLTVSKDATKTYQYILKLREKGLNIVNHGYTDPGPLYSSCAYLVYPSLNESFGLSLVEAAASGMKILAVDLPYVNSVIRPSASFHPERTASLSGIVFYAMKNAVPFPEILIRDQVDDLIKYLLT